MKKTTTANTVETAFAMAREAYQALGVDVEAVLKTLDDIAISIQCWQGDDVAGFENSGGLSDGGIQATGNYPGKARTAPEHFTARLALIKELKTMPFSAIWDYYCHRHDVPVGRAWLNEVKQYEKTVLSTRG